MGFRHPPCIEARQTLTGGSGCGEVDGTLCTASLRAGKTGQDHFPDGGIRQDLRTEQEDHYGNQYDCQPVTGRTFRGRQGNYPQDQGILQGNSHNVAGTRETGLHFRHYRIGLWKVQESIK